MKIISSLYTVVSPARVSTMHWQSKGKPKAKNTMSACSLRTGGWREKAVQPCWAGVGPDSGGGEWGPVGTVDLEIWSGGRHASQAAPPLVNQYFNQLIFSFPP